MPKLIEAEDLSKIINIRPEVSRRLIPFMMRLFSLEKLNEIYEKGNKNSPIDFAESVLNGLGIHYKIPNNEIDRLPKEGPFITISNHPYGGIEGLLLIKLLGKRFPKFKVLANFILERVEPLKEFFLGVNPFEEKKDIKSSYKGIKESITHLKSGGVLSIFPAGEVSSYQTNSRKIVDKVWEKGAIKLIKKANVPVVPIYFSGTNSKVFHLLGIIHPRLRTAKLPSEIFNKQAKPITIRIGKPILPKDLNQFNDENQLSRFLRARTYALGSTIEVQKIFDFSLNRFSFLSLGNTMANIAKETPKDLILEEIRKIRESTFIYKQGDYEIFLAFSNDIPNCLNEIGRLREKTFRKVDEGTGNPIDLDEYDLYYHHLILWCKSEERIVGGYRIGKGDDILAKYGKKGFYINSLFKLKNEIKPTLENCIELGRSFIIEEHQRKPFSLFSLWKGILYFLQQNPNYRFLIGPVSISNHYSNMSKSLMVNFIKSNYFDDSLAKYVNARHPFKFKKNLEEQEVLLAQSKENIKIIEKFIEDIEPSHYTLPVLLKKYIKQNAKIIGFNVDPNFKNALDGLMILDFKNIPKKTIEDLKGRN